MYVVAWWRTPPGATYTWILPPYPEDALAYLAWVRQAALGAVLFKLKYTALPQHALVFNPFFLIAGWLSRLSGASGGFSLFVLRAAGVVAFVLALDRLLGRLKLSARERTLALALVLFSSGFGAWSAQLPWAAAGAKASIDTWFVDSNTLWSLSWNPLFPFALTLVILIVSCLHEGLSRDDGRKYALAGALTTVLALLHPYDVGAPCFVALATSLYGRLPLRRSLAPFVLAAAPGIAYPLAISLRDPVLARHSAMGWMATPGLLDLLWGFGLPALLALWGLGAIARRNRIGELWPVLMWILGAIDLAYAPIWFQRKLIAGVHVPICVIAAIGADSLIAVVAGEGQAFAALAALLVVLSGATHVVNARIALRQIADPAHTQFYVPRDLATVLDSLSKESGPDQIVLSSIPTSQLIPGWSGNTVVYGHWAQTVDQAARDAWVARVLEPRSGAAPAERVRLLRQDKIAFVLVDGELRRTMGGKVPPWLLSTGRVVAHAGDFELLRL